MQAIIIEDKDILALLNEIESMDKENWENSAQPPWQDMHGRFVYIVVRWLQDQGASCVRGSSL